MGLSDLAFLAVFSRGYPAFTGRNAPDAGSGHKKTPGFRGFYGKNRKISYNILFSEKAAKSDRKCPETGRPFRI